MDFSIGFINWLFQQKKNSFYKFPYFIIGFIATMLIATYFPQGEKVYHILQGISKQLMVVALFMIGSLINLQSIKQAGFKTLSYGILLWIFISILSLVLVLNYF